MSALWIIGASSGIGRAVALQALQRGEAVVLSARDEAALKEVAIGYPKAHILPLDITNHAAVEKAVAGLPPLHAVHVYAGTYSPKAVAAWDWDEAARTIAVNLTSFMHLVHRVLPLLRAQAAQGQATQLALCASVAGYVGLPNGQPYSATKAALINFAQSLRAEELAFARQNNITAVDVRIINPGFVATRLTAKNTFPMPFLRTPEQAASAIWHQLSRRGRFAVHFPLPMHLLMTLLARLPSRLYFYLAGRM